MIYYPRGMHRQTAAVNAGLSHGEFPNTDRITETCLSLPMHPYLSDEDIAMISDAINDFFETRK